MGDSLGPQRSFQLEECKKVNRKGGERCQPGVAFQSMNFPKQNAGVMKFSNMDKTSLFWQRKRVFEAGPQSNANGERALPCWSHVALEPLTD